MIWTTRESKEIDIKDMTDSHLNNTIKFLKRKIDDYPGYQVYTGNGEIAEMAVEQENKAGEEHLEDCQYALEEMEKEQKHRAFLIKEKK